MAKQKRNTIQNSTSIESRSFSKGMVKDINESLMSEGTYLHARNAINNTVVGDMGVLSNEPSNDFCTQAPYTIIGIIHLYSDNWVIFSTDNVESEIGLFKEGKCEYSRIVNDRCLNFNKLNLIIGESKENFDCTWQVYWADNLNPDRTLNIDNVPYIQTCNTVNDCIICTDTTQLDCDKIRLAKLVTPPVLTLESSVNGGELLNGTYQAVIAYTENEIRVTDYSIPSNPVALFSHENVNGSIDIVIEEIDQTYDEFELVIISFVNQQFLATRIGIYSTNSKRIGLDKIDATLTTVPLEFLVLDRPSYERSEGIYRNGEYLLRVAPTTKFSFNYQLLANNIQTEWVGIEYPKDYYRKGGKNTGYMRDEVYSFFIRWIYNTYDKSDCYHIPGRSPLPGEANVIASPVYGTGFNFEENNTAGFTIASGTTDDGGTIVAKGTMAYWESSEQYPDRSPDVWGSLCGKKIRHHKFPDNEIINHFNQANENIVVLGVQFRNIAFPVDLNGNPIDGIIGYEILRGTREGNKSIVAKGLINNMGSYNREDNNELAYYPNYPYNDLRQDPFLSTQFIQGITDQPNNPSNALGGAKYSRNHFTFHSPDTNFKNPFLSAKELKVYETLHGTTEGKFVEPYLHPKHKIITDAAFLISAVVGFGIAVKATQGEKKTIQGRPFVAETQWLGPSNINTAIAAGVASSAADGVITGVTTTENFTGGNKFANIISGLAGDTSILDNAAIITANTVATAIPGVSNISYYEWDTEGKTGLPGVLRILQAIPTFLAFWGEGTDSFLRIIKAFSKFRQYALAYESHCFYKQKNLTHANFKTRINNAGYIKNRLQQLGISTINNLYRSSSVGVITQNTIPDPAITDTSRQKVSDVYPTTADLVIDEMNTVGVASSHYVGLKQRLRNQYGQINGIRKIPTSSKYKRFVADPTNPPFATSDIIFGGDVYIGRYTEKNTFFFYQDWMYNLPDDFEYDYRLRKMMPYPTYWMDTKDFQISDFFQGLIDSFTGGPAAALPSGFHNFDRGSASSGSGFTLSLIVKDAYMYLFNSGVRDFYVESEVNVEYRDWDEEESRRHYDPYFHTSLSDLFRTDIIKSGNFYKYDYSLSASRFFQGYPDWGSVQERNYDPLVSETCYSYYPNRIIYSLPQSLEELKIDNWKTYLVDNYKDFTSKITSVKPIGKNGAMILFENEAPIQFAGVDTLETGSGTKITIGDGGLFAQPMQNLVNSDKSYEYGSCQNRLSVINTPAGLFWISQNQGKIFSYTGKLEEISQQGMKWWFEEYGSYKLVEDFPDYDLTDNPVVGIGCQAIYDNSNSIVYFTKKDYRIKDYYKRMTVYSGNNLFSVGGAIVALGDPIYFDNASWTISYDPKTRSWISFHDWHPDLMIPSKNNFLTIKNNNIWRHNDRNDSYCNFYGVNHPFDVELVIPTGVTVNTLRSIEYYMEVYRWDLEGVDKHHVLDFNFDKAIVYNTEQVSGELRMILNPKNNPILANQYPQLTGSGINILYSKEEQKYRFNQFWDITDDRGEFSTARRFMWNTQSNGYIKTLNPANLNYNKSLLQRKKFRHYLVNLYLRREVSGPNNMQVKLINSKNQYSSR